MRWSGVRRREGTRCAEEHVISIVSMICLFQMNGTDGIGIVRKHRLQLFQLISYHLYFVAECAY